MGKHVPEQWVDVISLSDAGWSKNSRGAMCVEIGSFWRPLSTLGLWCLEIVALLIDIMF